MTKLFLAAGVAALAIAAPVSAKPEKGGGGGEHKAHAAKAERGGGGHKSHAVKAERRGGNVAFKEKGSNREFKAQFKEKRADRAFKPKGDDRNFAKFDRKDRDVVRVRDFDDDRFDGRRTAHWNGDNNWCPPGHAKANCMPPGQYKKLVLGRAIPSAFRNSMLPLGLRDFYRDDDDHYYRLGDNGYLFRVDRDTNLVASLLPLFGAGLMPGQMFPSSYASYGMPLQYQPFYQDNPDDYYRFANGYVYEIDRDSGMIENMVPLMANGYGMGQMLPLSYSAYNVPYQYRGLYADNNDYMYRYAPGAIYQVDPTTRLITAVASLLTGNGLSVGQPMPMGYSAYNVPLGYRDQYYDTADNWYRYNNGNIYQVDPKTQLVTALIRAIV